MNKPVHPTTEAATPLSFEHLRALIVLQTVVVAPLLLYLPPPLALVLISVAIFCLKTRERTRRLNKSALLLATVFSLALILMFHAKYNLVEMMFGILSLSFILKLLEIRRADDSYTIIYLAFILIAANLIFNPSLFATLYSGACVIYLVALWRYLHVKSKSDFHQHLRWSLFLIVKAAPIFIIIFLLAPRLNPIWNLPSPTQNTTGFSDNLDLSDISELAQDTSTAFRTTFHSPRPPYHELYWHGVYLTHYDGKTWTAQFSPPETDTSNNEPIELNYSVLLEPHHHNQLFHLGRITHVTSQQKNLQLHKDGSLTSSRPITKRMGYSVEALVSPSPAEQGPLNVYLALPQGNPRTVELVSEWMLEELTPREIIQRALDFFASDFRYSLNPPPLGRHQIDDFLFESRIGFCGHYASSFAFILRLAKIPTRLVSGYMGGTYNPVEDYLRVQQSDAHAWVEVFLDDQWQRIDPTSIVAPERLSLEPAARSGQARDIQIVSYFTQGSFLHRLELQWDAIDFAWQRLVINFNQDEYLLSLERWLGFRPLWAGFILGGVVVLALLCGALLPQYFRRASQTPKAKTIAAWQQFVKRLAKRGILIPAEQTPEQFLMALAEANPAQAALIHRVAFLLRQILYANNSQHASAFIRSIRQLQPHQLAPQN